MPPSSYRERTDPGKNDMIKYGAHCYIFTERWSDESLGLLDTARGLGLDCLEIAVGDDVQFTPALTRRQAESLGLTLIVSPGGQWPTEYDLSAEDPKQRRQGLRWHESQVDLAAELGAVAYTGALYGHPGTVLRRRPPHDQLQWAAEMLHTLAEYAGQRGVTIALEPMSHFRTHVVNTPEQAMHLLGLAGHDNLGVLLDTYHMLTEVKDYTAAIHTVGKRLWGLHACENDRGAPGGGLVPWGAVFGALQDIGFDGYVALEAYNSSIDDFAIRRGMFHDVCPDGEAFVRQGLGFINEVQRRGLQAGAGPRLPTPTA